MKYSRLNEHQHFQADEDKQYGIEDFIHQFPEGIQVFPHRVRHGQQPSVVAD
jgi:hypothetical protein